LIAITLLKPSGGPVPVEQLNQYPAEIRESEVLWVDCNNPSGEELASLKDRFQLDEYAIEDVMHRDQRPKMEDYGKNVFGVIHIPVVKPHKGPVIAEMFVFFQKNWIITIHTGEEDIVHNVWSRVKARGLSPLATTPSPDLLFYLFLDFAVDAYYPLLDEMEDRLEEIDKRAVTSFRSRVKRMEAVVEIMTTVESVRKGLMILRRSLAPTRDTLGMVMRGAVPFVNDSSLRSFRDVYDHSFQLLETIDNDRDRTSDVRDLYISLHSASTDNTIKLLTLVATIFLPLGLLASIYGMNFAPGFFQPGSGDPLGFYVLVLGMGLITVGLLYAFRRSGWI